MASRPYPAAETFENALPAVIGKRPCAYGARWPRRSGQNKVRRRECWQLAAALGEEPRRRRGGNEPATRGQKQNTTVLPGTLLAPPAATPRPPFRSRKAKRFPTSSIASLRVPHKPDHPSPLDPGELTSAPPAPLPQPPGAFAWRREMGRGNATTCPDTESSRPRREPRAPLKSAGLPRLGSVRVWRRPGLTSAQASGEGSSHSQGPAPNGCGLAAAAEPPPRQGHRETGSPLRACRRAPPSRS